MDTARTDVIASEAALTRWGRTAALVVLAAGALNELAWVADIWRLLPSWPRSTPWTGIWLAALSAAILAQSGHPSSGRVWIGRGLAASVGVLAVCVLAEHLTAGSFGIPVPWWHATESGRPTPRTAASVIYLAAAVTLMRIDRRRTGALWGIFVVAALAAPIITLTGNMFKAVSEVRFTESTGQGISTAIGVLLLVAATVAARPDRNPAAWLLARPDRWALLRLLGILGGLPVLVGVLRLPFLVMGLSTDVAWILATTVATIVVGMAVFYLSQREQRALIDKERLSRQRVDAEMRYRILADNAVDVIFHLRGNRVAWVSPSVAAAFGQPSEQWLGTSFRDRIHPDDLDAVAAGIQRTTPDNPVLVRFRVRAADGGYHWVDGHGKPYIDAEGDPDGLIAALRIVDDQVEAQQRLDRLARFDTLTGLPNRAEVIARLESALDQPRSPGAHLGLLFCDVDHFKTINDTLGHAAGDLVLATLATRITESIRQGDTVGRTGGDEMIVLLPGVHSLDEAARIAEKIRCRAAEPIYYDGRPIRATLSIGATISVAGESATALTARADEAMYEAKSRARNTVVPIEPAGLS